MLFTILTEFRLSLNWLCILHANNIRLLSAFVGKSQGVLAILFL